ncbi:AzlD domain-containing protein [uncultured Vagococcus sp.]|uniref:AzlD domain-containing protein n=1 Tax=uncultured Vagococcus sp. TaxID=189676 RepID=UPI0028D04B76|nr:AzlD domain-containing protein [uncultured Vagococcus sp.]
MTANKMIVLTIVLCGVVTWVPRIAPFILSKKMTFSKGLNEFLSYLPMCILTALFVQGLLVQQSHGLPTFNSENILASLPTIAVGVISRDLMWTVIVGIISMAALRFFM